MPETIVNMLKQFGKQPGCERYAGDGERSKMLADYLWCRQLDPAITFEVFLQRFAPLADFDEKNKKHPADAMRYFCPRASKQAEAQGMPQWSAKEVVEFTALYVDMIRLAESEGTEVAITLQQFLEQMAAPFKAGAFNVAPEPAAARVPEETKPKRQKAAKATEPGPCVAITVGMRGIYTLKGHGRQIRGEVTNIITDAESEKQYADFLADDGENFHEVNLHHIAPTDASKAKVVDPRLVKERQKLWIPKAQTQQVLSALSCAQPMGNVEVGAVIYPFAQGYSDGKAAMLNVVNGADGPYVDAQLINGETDEVLADCPPRKNIVGTYDLITDAGVYVLEVCLRE